MKDDKKILSKEELKKKLDAVFSLYVRTSRSVNGVCTCYTCGKEMPIKSAQCGHMFSRSRQSTRYYEDNVEIQCYGCNIAKKGNYDEFIPRYIKRNGLSRYMYVYSLSLAPHTWTVAELEDLIYDYSDALAKITLSE